MLNAHGPMLKKCIDMPFVTVDGLNKFYQVGAERIHVLRDLSLASRAVPTVPSRCTSACTST